LTAVLTSTDPVYAETVELTRELENHGFVVRCVLQLKMANTFQGQLGAALYRTSRGDFEALFLPKPRTFFAKRANRFFIAWGGMQLAADLGEVLNPA
jgi:hypothetical protein